MFTIRRSLPASLMFIFVLLGFSYYGETQNEDCPTLVQEALTSVDQLCQDVARNTACYGHNRVEASFDTDADLIFSEPSDQVAIEQLRTLQTFPLDTDSGLWGVALMNVQANLPDTLPGQAVRFLLFGDVSIENAGEPQPEITPCPATTTAKVNIRSGPGTEFNVVSSTEKGMAIEVIGRTEDSAWVYVKVDDNIGWMSAEFIETECDLTTIPVRDPEDKAAYGPMQAFYFTTGVAEPACKEVPASSLVIQSPQGFVVNLSINGVNVGITSTVSLTAPEGENMSITTLEGKVVTSMGNIARVIPEGFAMEIPLATNEEGHPVPEGTFNEIEFIENDDWETIEEYSGDLFEIPVEVPDNSEWSDFDDFCADPANADWCGDPLFQSGQYVCGDKVCDPYEYCADDCGVGFCGDSFCDPYYLGEDADTCGADCGQISFCGDYYCAPNEDASTCPYDCNQDTDYAICGDYVCQLGEDAQTCPSDCGMDFCGDFICDAWYGENQLNCGSDCGWSSGVCGDLVCDPSIGEDSNTCPYDCGSGGSGGGGYCGDYVCDPSLGEDSSTCDFDCGGGSGGGYCGDYVCDPSLGEDSNTCSFDCGSGGGGGGYCGDYVCAPNIGEDGYSCGTDCGYCGDYVCDAGLGEDSSTCGNDCGGGGGGYCGDYICDPNLGEDSSTCSFDCGGGGGYCGDYICDPFIGEDGYSCGWDCGYCGDFICDPSLGEDTGTCSSDCY